MPERNIQEIVGRMVTDPDFNKKILNPVARKRILDGEYKDQLTQEEHEKIGTIKAGSLQEFSQALINAGLVKL
jgi:hypothetical protein